nr:MAG TPA: hypothetical protein [Bacteriophage sp.]DAN64227.1 MAG TPA: hypothetical protein [Bacteriophage sp.]DAU46326.1 MAG TPA: hypothetical protein [Bacteriophage sp.]
MYLLRELLQAHSACILLLFVTPTLPPARRLVFFNAFVIMLQIKL